MAGVSCDRCVLAFVSGFTGKWVIPGMSPPSLDLVTVQAWAKDYPEYVVSWSTGVQRVHKACQEYSGSWGLYCLSSGQMVYQRRV